MSGVQTFWCHDCDMSVTLLPTLPPLCPHCHASDYLELMDHLTTNTTTFPSPNLEHLIHHLAQIQPDLYGTSPASKSSIQSIPTIKITASFLSPDPIHCAVCKDEFEIDIEAKQLPCSHIYHLDCILPWLSNHNSCPVCRFQLPVDDPELGTDGSSVRGLVENFVEDDLIRMGMGSTLRYITRRHRRLLVPLGSSPVIDSYPSPTQLAQVESGLGRANSGETVSSRSVEGMSSLSGSRVDDDGDAVVSEVRGGLRD